MPYVKVTGYLEVDDVEIDKDHASGLTTDAYERYTTYTTPRPPTIADLEDLTTSPDDRHPQF